MAAPNDGLTTAQGFQLIFEQTAARNLLGYGVRALRASAFHDTTADPVMTMLSIGVEKILKLGLGLEHVVTNRAWPAKVAMQNTYRHNLVMMDRTLRQTLRENLDRATHRPVVEAHLDAVDNDPVWLKLVETLNRYGAMGWFYYLDALAESPQVDDPPSEYWDKAERAALDSDVQLTELFHLAAQDFNQWDRFTSALNARLAESIERWWEALVMAGKHGVLGERGVLWGFDVGIDMVGRQVKGAQP